MRVCVCVCVCVCVGGWVGGWVVGCVGVGVCVCVKGMAGRLDQGSGVSCSEACVICNFLLSLQEKLI